MRPTARPGGGFVLVVAALLAAAPTPLAAGDGFPQGMVAFTVSEDGSCPAGWQPATYAAGRLILSVASPADAMKSVGEPIADRTDPSHDHDYGFSFPIGGFKYSLSPETALGSAISVELSGTSEATTTGYPFLQAGVCEAVGGVDDDLPYATIAHFSGASCPPGGAWTPLQQADGRFLLPNPAGASSSGVSYGHWSVGSAGHSHPFSSVSLDWPTKSVDELVLLPLTPNFILPVSPLPLVETSGSSLMAPFVSLLTCEKIEDTGSGTFTEPIAVFYGSSGCAQGWEPVTASAGRFVVGLPSGGTQLAAFGGSPMVAGEQVRSHLHAVSGSVDVPALMGHGGNAEVSIDLVPPGSVDYQIDAGSEGGLPYYTASLCRPTGAAAAK